MVGVYDNFKMNVGESKNLGIAKISAFEFKNSENPLFNLRARRDGDYLAIMDDGKYIRLHINGELMMSDTRMEKLTNTVFCEKANGKVMIAGLGVGLIIQNIKDKIDNGVVTEIIIIEKSQDVIDLVSPFYKDFPIKYICADVLEYIPSKDEIYDTIYFDIWANAFYEDNLPEIEMLHNRWKNHKNKKNKNSWMNSWMKEHMQRQKRKFESDPINKFCYTNPFE